MSQEVQEFIKNIKVAEVPEVLIVKKSNLNDDFVKDFVKSAKAMDIEDAEINKMLVELSNLKHV